MTGEWEPADWTPILRRHRRQLVVGGPLQLLIPAGLLIGRAWAGRSLLTFGVVACLFYGVLAALSLRPLWSTRARARWEEQVKDEEVLDHALGTRSPVGPELHERVRERARKFDSDAVLATTLGLLAIVIVAGLNLSDGDLARPWRVVGCAAAGVAAALFVVLPARRARPARRWLADPPAPLVPDDATHRG